MSENKLNDNSFLLALIGKKLSAVVFVQDYIQVQFDGVTITALKFPLIKLGAKSFRFGDGEYRNKLCEQINKEVVDISTEKESQITILLGGDSRPVLQFETDISLPETIIFQNDEGRIQVW